MPLVLIVVVAVVFLLRVGSEWTMRIFSNVYLDTELSTPTVLIGVLFASGQLFVLAALWAPLAMSRFGKERTIILGTIGMALAFLPLLLMAHWLSVGLGFIAMIALVAISAPAYSIFSQEIVRPEWRTTMSSASMLSLGIGEDLMIHDIDILQNVLFQKELESSAAGNVDAASALFRFEDVSAFISASRKSSKKIRRIYIEEEDLTVEGDFMNQEVYTYYKPDKYKVENERYVQENIIEKVMVNKVEPLKDELQTFLECVKHGRPFPLLRPRRRFRT